VEHFVSQLIAALGSVPLPVIYLIAAVWMGLESSGIGVPIEPVLLFLGSLAAQGSVNLPLMIVCASVGCLAGATLAYAIGRCVGMATVARFGRYVGLTQARIEHIDAWLRHRGSLGVFLLRLTPVIRTFGSFVVGEADIPIPVFVVGTLAGAVVYNGVWAILGNFLGANYRAPLHFLDQFGSRGVALAVVVVLVVVGLHHFWGRLALRRMAVHFHRHHQHTPAVVAEQAIR
jgi:membrane protein DedA with SNARE-associated domain